MRRALLLTAVLAIASVSGQGGIGQEVTPTPAAPLPAVAAPTPEANLSQREMTALQVSLAARKALEDSVDSFHDQIAELASLIERAKKRHAAVPKAKEPEKAAVKPRERGGLLGETLR
jgi:hypothetical protein